MLHGTRDGYTNKANEHSSKYLINESGSEFGSKLGNLEQQACQGQMVPVVRATVAEAITTITISSKCIGRVSIDFL